METSLDERHIIDSEHLRLLRRAYFVSAAVAGFYVGMGLLYVVMGATLGNIVDSIPTTPGQPGEAFPKAFFMIFGLIFTLVGTVLGLLRLYTAKCLRLRTSLWVCHLTAALACLEIPWGTALGVTTFVILSRDSVRAMFAGNRAQ